MDGKYLFKGVEYSKKKCLTILSVVKKTGANKLFFCKLHCLHKILQIHCKICFPMRIFVFHVQVSCKMLDICFLMRIFIFCTCNPSQRSVVATHDQIDGCEYLFQQIFIKTLQTNQVYLKKTFHHSFI